MANSLMLARPCGHTHGPRDCGECKVRSLAVCAALSTNELIDLEALVDHVEIRPKSTFVHEDDPATAVYSLTDGMARLYKLLPDGRRQIVGFAMAGDFLGLALNNRYGFSADAIDQVNLCRFDRRDFDRLVGDKPHLLRRLHEFATHELIIAQEQMMLIGRRMAEERVAAFLIAMRDRWARIKGPSVTVELPMQRNDIADYLGLTIETVSRSLTKLARDRVILIVPDAVRILDEPKLIARARG